MTLKSIRKQETLDYYTRFLDHEGVATGFEDEDNHPQYAITIDAIDVAVSQSAILFKHDDGIYRLDMFDEDGNETISGISSLTHTDNFIYAQLVEEGKNRHFICLDSINRNLDVEELLGKPYFHRIESLDEVF